MFANFSQRRSDEQILTAIGPSIMKENKNKRAEYRKSLSIQKKNKHRGRK